MTLTRFARWPRLSYAVIRDSILHPSVDFANYRLLLQSGNVLVLVDREELVDFIDEMSPARAGRLRQHLLLTGNPKLAGNLDIDKLPDYLENRSKEAPKYIEELNITEDFVHPEDAWKLLADKLGCSHLAHSFFDGRARAELAAVYVARHDKRLAPLSRCAGLLPLTLGRLGGYVRIWACSVDPVGVRQRLELDDVVQTREELIEGCALLPQTEASELRRDIDAYPEMQDAVQSLGRIIEKCELLSKTEASELVSIIISAALNDDTTTVEESVAIATCFVCLYDGVRFLEDLRQAEFGHKMLSALIKQIGLPDLSKDLPEHSTPAWAEMSPESARTLLEVACFAIQKDAAYGNLEFPKIFGTSYADDLVQILDHHAYERQPVEFPALKTLVLNQLPAQTALGHLLKYLEHPGLENAQREPPVEHSVALLVAHREGDGVAQGLAHRSGLDALVARARAELVSICGVRRRNRQMVDGESPLRQRSSDPCCSSRRASTFVSALVKRRLGHVRA